MKAWFLKDDSQLWEKVIETFEGDHAHMELQFSDGLFFSSTTDDGPRFCTFDKTCDPDATHWDVIEIPITSQDEAIVRALAEMVCVGTSGKDQVYGWDHILGGFLPVALDQDSPNTWICSGSCVYVCQSVGLFMGYFPQRVSPHDAYKILMNPEYFLKWEALRFKAIEGK